MDIKDLFTIWLSSLKGQGLKPDTIQRYEKFLVDFIPRIDSTSLNESALLQKISEWWDEGYTKYVMWRKLKALKSFLGFCVKVDTDNRAKWLALQSVVDLPTPPPSTRKIPIKEEVEAIIAAAGIAYEYRTLVSILLMTDAGLRIGECSLLCWRDIDFSVPSMMVGEKNDKKRLLPVGHSPRLLQSLLDRRSYYDREILPNTTMPKPHYVMSNLLRMPPARDNIRRMVKSAIKAANIKPFGVHGFRHYFAQTLIESGVDVFTLQKVLGHSTIQSTWTYIQKAQLSVGKMEESLRLGLVPE